MRIVLAYSGSLEGSAAIAWLRERYQADIVAVTIDLGQGRELESIRDRALALGAQRAHVLDARDEFAQDFVAPALRADALRDGGVPFALELSRPLIARKLVEIARIERTQHVAHTGEVGARSSRLDTLLGVIAPDLQVVAPAREWTLRGAELEAFARSHGVRRVPGDMVRAESNLWGRTFRFSGNDESPIVPRATDGCPTEPATVEISFSEGVPTELNGVPLPLVELIGSLGTLASTHGVGYVKSDAQVCDAPAAVLLHAAHRELTHAAVAPDVEQFSLSVTAAYIEMLEHAQWFSPLRDALGGYIAAAQTPVNGRVGLRLLKGTASTVAIELTQSPTHERAVQAAS
jgi:argininosuccinate synthase